jgi:hypothetical protein
MASASIAATSSSLPPSPLSIGQATRGVTVHRSTLYVPKGSAGIGGVNVASEVKRSVGTVTAANAANDVVIPTEDRLRARDLVKQAIALSSSR